MLDSMLWSDTSIHKKESYKWDYQTVGKRKFITEEYEIVEDVTKELDEERIRKIEETFSYFLNFDEFKAAHCSSCPAGEDCTGYYFNAVAGSICAVDYDEDDYDESKALKESEEKDEEDEQETQITEDSEIENATLE